MLILFCVAAPCLAAKMGLDTIFAGEADGAKIALPREPRALLVLESTFDVMYAALARQRGSGAILFDL